MNSNPTLYLHIYQNELKPDTIKTVADLCRKAPEGKTKLIVCVVTDQDEVVFVESNLRPLTVSRGLLHRFDKTLGEDHYRIKRTDCQPPPRRWVPQNKG